MMTLIGWKKLQYAVLFGFILSLGGSGCSKKDSGQKNKIMDDRLQQIFEDPATHFNATGELGGACGIHPDLIESTNFVALNVQNTPGDYTSWLPRPNQEPRTTGIWNNGLNCGRWVRVTLSDKCVDGHVSGRKDEPKCSQYQSDDKNGATADFVVTDSCQDDNQWCRDYPYHLDLSTASLKTFVKDGKNLGDLSQNWDNRKVIWQFIEAPQKKPLEIHFVRNAQLFWATIGITHLKNGLHGVLYENRDGTWTKANMNGDNGQTYQISPKNDQGQFSIKIIDAQDYEEPTIYDFSFPCQGICSNPYTKVSYQTRGQAQQDQLPSPPSTPTPQPPLTPVQPTPPQNDFLNVPPSVQNPPTGQSTTLNLSVNLKPQSQWDGGYCMEIEITHNEPRTLRNWSFDLQVPKGHIQNTWNIQISSQSSGLLSIKPTEPWAKSVSPGQLIGGMGICVSEAAWPMDAPKTLQTYAEF